MDFKLDHFKERYNFLNDIEKNLETVSNCEELYEELHVIVQVSSSIKNRKGC